MSFTLSPTQSNSADGPATRPLVYTLRPTDLNDWMPSERPSLGNRASRALVRYPIAFCIGIAATLAWQSYGDVAREMIANSSAQLNWLAPPAALVARTAPETIGAASSPDQQRLEATPPDLAVMRQSVDQLIASHEQTIRSVDRLAGGLDQVTRRVDELATGQEQMTRDITKLAAEQNTLRKIASAPPPRPAAAPARKPASLTPFAPSVDSVQ